MHECFIFPHTREPPIFVYLLSWNTLVDTMKFIFFLDESWHVIILWKSFENTCIEREAKHINSMKRKISIFKAILLSQKSWKTIKIHDL